jgi:hypothetical protein
MLITSRFVVINVPKSGSSFVRSAIKAVYDRRFRRHPIRRYINKLCTWSPAAETDFFLKELILPNTRLPGRPKDQHGVALQIPQKYRDRDIVSVIRNPYEKIVSEYRFRWWATFPPMPVDRLQALFPDFPDLSFDQFLGLSDHIADVKMAGQNEIAIGNMTVEFVQFFFRNPFNVLRRLSEEYVRSGDFRADMIDTHFLRQECLNDDLAGFLSDHGFDAEDVQLCRDHDRVNVTVNDAAEHVAWTRWALDHFIRSERHLLSMLDTLGFTYALPVVASEVG